MQILRRLCFWILEFPIFTNKMSITKIFGMTINYCPPEIKYSDLSLITPKADIFSFGMFFMIL